ncbi:assembly factor cbp4 [Ascosphaera aggregata]|nr:assembly factor cbp4 [Ascosphaera aggregata]
MARGKALAKMAVVGAIFVIGGPALVDYVRPTEEELFQKFNPELQRRNLDLREQRQRDFDAFVTQLKEHSKTDKTIWDSYREKEARRVREYAEARRKEEESGSEKAQKEAIEKELSG